MMAPVMQQPLSILMIDDDKEDAFLVQWAIKRLKASVDFKHVKDGRAFVQSLDTQPGGLASVADVILLDINMPGFDGFDVLDRLAARPDFEDVKVIMFSTSETREDRERAKSMGADGFQTKPNTADDLRQFLSTLTH